MEKRNDSDKLDKTSEFQTTFLQKDEIPPDTDYNHQYKTNSFLEQNQANRISQITQKLYQIPQENQIYQIVAEPIVQEYKENENHYIYQSEDNIPVIYQISQDRDDYQGSQVDSLYYPTQDYQNIIINKIYQNNLSNNIFQNIQKKKNKITRITKIVRTAPVDQINGANYVKNKNNIIKANKLKLRNRNKQPQDSISKIVIYSSRDKFSRNNENIHSSIKTYNNSLNNDSSHNYTKISPIKKLDYKISNISNKENFSDYEEIPRTKYNKYYPNSTIFIGKGMETGEYKFVGGKTQINKRDFSKPKMVLSKNIFNKIDNKKIKKVNPRNKLKFEVVDKFYTLTEYESKSIKRLGQNQSEKYQKQVFNTTNKINNEKIYKFEHKFDDRITKSDNQSKIYKKIKESNSNTYKNIIKYDNNSNFVNNLRFNNSASICPMDNYSKYLFEQINKIRSDPQSFIGLIEDAKDNIIKDRYGRIIYKGKIKIALSKGKPAFDEAIEFLKKIKPMKKLEFNHIISPKLPQNENEIKDKNDLKKKVENMINNGINIKSYWRDVIKDPEISFLLMIVDDNGVKSGKKRKDILNSSMKYIGISSVEINGKFVCYITLSSGKQK